MATLLDQLRQAIGDKYVLEGDECAPWSRDWMDAYKSTPLAVVRPADTAEVARVMQIAQASGTPVVPMAGNTGLVGGGKAEGQLVLSVDRLNQIREIRADARLAIVGAGVVLSALHDAAAAHDLVFPLTFGARGSAMIGGVLSTNAGGSNVLRYGNTRDLCLGIEVVLADGRVMNLMSELHKDNSGYNLRNLFIGAEGTLGVITAAVFKLRPRPRAYVTAMLAAPGLDGALTLLNRLQLASGGGVEAFEYMPRAFIARHLELIQGAREPFGEPHEVNLMVEIGAVSQADATPGADGVLALTARVEETLAELLDEGAIADAVIAQNEAQRREMWARREAAAELAHGIAPFVDTDIALPLDRVATFFDQITPRIRALDPDAGEFSVAHLGDGNIHYSIHPATDDSAVHDAMVEAVEELVLSLGGSFSAEHGIGLSKLNSMRRRKDPVALDVMRTIKLALDPGNILNPGKVLPGKSTK